MTRTDASFFNTNASIFIVLFVVAVEEGQDGRDQKKESCFSQMEVISSGF